MLLTMHLHRSSSCTCDKISHLVNLCNRSVDCLCDEQSWELFTRWLKIFVIRIVTSLQDRRWASEDAIKRVS